MLGMGHDAGHGHVAGHAVATVMPSTAPFSAAWRRRSRCVLLVCAEEAVASCCLVQIRVFGYARATNGFDSRKHCDKRR